MQQVLYVLEANRIKAVGPKPFIILPCAIFLCKLYRVFQVKLDETKQLFQTEKNQWGSKTGFVHVL